MLCLCSTKQLVACTAPAEAGHAGRWPTWSWKCGRHWFFLTLAVGRYLASCLEPAEREQDLSIRQPAHRQVHERALSHEAAAACATSASLGAGMDVATHLLVETCSPLVGTLPDDFIGTDSSWQLLYLNANNFEVGRA